MALSYRPHLLRNTSVYSPAKKNSQPTNWCFWLSLHDSGRHPLWERHAAAPAQQDSWPSLNFYFLTLMCTSLDASHLHEHLYRLHDEYNRHDRTQACAWAKKPFIRALSTIIINFFFSSSFFWWGKRRYLMSVMDPSSSPTGWAEHPPI